MLHLVWPICSWKAGVRCSPLTALCKFSHGGQRLLWLCSKPCSMPSTAWGDST